jgi:Transposase IS116/IS110/IS902 family
VNGKMVFSAGESNIAVFAIDQQTGEPTAIRHADIRAAHPWTFGLDTGARVLIAGSLSPSARREDGKVVDLPSGLTVFRTGADGKLAFARKYDIDVGAATQWWTGMMPLAWRERMFRRHTPQSPQAAPQDAVLEIRPPELAVLEPLGEQAIRGVALINAVTIVAEVGDFSRFGNPRQLMAYLGLVAQQIVLQDYIDSVTDAERRVDRLTLQITEHLPGWSMAEWK